MQENIQIVQPILEDAIESIEVQYRAWLETYPNKKAGVTKEDVEERYKDAFTGSKLEKRKKIITDPEPNEKFIIAKDRDRVVGMCYGDVQEDKNQLKAIYILPEYHGKGIGTKLWEALYPFFNNTNDTYVEVVDYNEKAISFYKKLGFVDTGKRFQDERFRMKSGAIFTEMEMVKKAESSQ